MIPPKKHGGPRKGAGRPAGKKSKNAKGRLALSRSVSMPEETWARLDQQRGEQSRGKYIAAKLLKPGFDQNRFSIDAVAGREGR